MTPLSRLGALPNFLLYQIAWFACLLGAAGGQPLAGVAIALGVAGLHLALARSPATELAIVLLTGVIGGVWEYVMMNQDWVRYAGAESARFPPAWIIALWLSFATTFNIALRWLQDRLIMAALLGLIGGPLAWYAGQRMGALVLPDPPLDLMFIGAGWAVLMPLLLRLTQELTITAPTNATPED